MRRAAWRADGGFTLVELAIVILVIGVLLAIGLPQFLGTRTRAQDRAAQSDVRGGLAAALVYYTDTQNFTGFDVTDGEAIELSLEWIAGGAPGPGVGEVAIEVASGDTVLLVTRSASQTYFCLARQSSNSYGRGATWEDVNTVPECAGGW